MLRRFLSLAFAFAAGLPASVCAAATPAQPGPARIAPAAARAPWLLVSDLHFDPFADPALDGALAQAPASGWHAIFARSTAGPSAYFTDTNAALLESSLAAMRARAPSPAVVIVAGDFLAHEFPQRFARAVPGASSAAYEAFVDKTIAFLALELGSAFPGAQFLVTPGNNDGYCGDYAAAPGSPFLAHFAAAFGPLVDREGRAPGFARDFSRAGYYTAELPGDPAGEVVALDSIYWSAKYHDACGSPDSDPGGAELQWLAARLTERPAPAYRWFLTHIPPGPDQYSSLRAGHPVPFLQPAAAQRLVALTEAARPAAFVFGHVHHASFEVVGPGDGSGVPGLVVPSISPVQGNDPAFIVADVTAAGVLSDFKTYVLPLEEPGAPWTFEYDFDGAYGAAAFETRDLVALQARLAAEPALWQRYARYYNSGSTTAAIAAGTWPWYWCGDLESDDAAYGACVANLLPVQAAGPNR
jgi:hypothetical protein